MSLNKYFSSPCGVCGNHYGHHQTCSYWSQSGIAEKMMFEQVNQQYNSALFKVQDQNIELINYIEKEIIKGSNIHVDKRSHAREFLEYITSIRN